MRPTFRTALLFLAGIPLSLVLVLIDPAWWVVGPAHIGFASLLTVLDMLLTVGAGNLQTRFRLPTSLYLGDPGALEVQFALTGRRASATVDVLCDVGTLLVPPPLDTVTLASGETPSVFVPLQPTRRGTAEVFRLWLRWRGPLGLILRHKTLPVDGTVPVIPNLNAVRQAALTFTAWDAIHGTKWQQQSGEGSEFNALRDWVPGMDHRAMDWKQSARHHKLVCKEFDVERNHHIVMALDTGHLMCEPFDGLPRIDHAINATLLVGWASLKAGDRVGLFAFDSQVRHFQTPVGGTGAFTQLQKASANFDYSHDETNFTLGLSYLASRLERRSLIVVQSDFVDTVTAELMIENLQRLSARHLVLFVSLRNTEVERIVTQPPSTMGAVVRSVIADDIAQERRVVLEKLRRLGVLCLETTAERLNTDLMNRYLLIKRQELI